MVDAEVYKRIRILALERNMEVSAIIEEAMREKLERDFPQYKPLPPPSSQHQQTHEQIQQGSLITLPLLLPGIEFPKDKSNIIKYAEEANSVDMNPILRSISNRTYKNESDLENELLKRVKAVNKNVVFEIDTRKLRKEEQKETLSKQKNELRKTEYVKR
jgi:hypothetical protein